MKRFTFETKQKLNWYNIDPFEMAEILSDE